MSTYYLVVNDTKKEFINPIYFGGSIKKRGVFNGIHALGIADLMIHTREIQEPPQINNIGYWSGDSLRVLGDNCEKEHSKIINQYRNVSFYVLANIFENGSYEIKNKVLMLSAKNNKILQGLLSVSYEYEYRYLNYQLTNTIKNK